jgi:hypothetical protein
MTFYWLYGVRQMIKETLLPSPKKHCPICSLDLPITDFGVCRSRKDGRNLYCKSCIRNKVTQSRRALKAYKTARKKYLTQIEIPDLTETSQPTAARYSAKAICKLSPVERVRESIRKGCRTQKEIAQDTKLGKDEICDALANLVLWTKEIRTRVRGNTRLYFLNENCEANNQDEGPAVPPRKPDVPSSFSCLHGLMPGKNPEGEPEKIGGWVAA